MRIRFLALARRELMREAAWYDDRSPGLGDRLLGQVGVAMREISEFPEAHPPLGEPYRHFLLDVFPFALIYRHDKEAGTILIVAFAHVSRRPNYWRRRDKPSP